MNLIIDIGNSSVKAGLYPSLPPGVAVRANRRPLQGTDWEFPNSVIRSGLEDDGTFSSFLRGVEVSHCIISSTSIIPSWLTDLLSSCSQEEPVVLDGHTPLPIRNLYSTPSTLGSDRLAAAIGGYYEAGCRHPVLCIDCGTAITYDFMTRDGEYLGGNISPGIEMRFRALHDYTARLPLVGKTGECPAIGQSTESAIRSGVISGVRHEIMGYITSMKKKNPDVFIFLTGGDHLDFEYRSKKRIFADNNLVLKGLHIILSHILTLK